MREEYDFLNSVANPYAKKIKKQISIKLEVETVEYFKILAQKIGIPYQNLINSYLSECVKKEIKPTMAWGS